MYLHSLMHLCIIQMMCCMFNAFDVAERAKKNR